MFHCVLVVCLLCACFFVFSWMETQREVQPGDLETWRPGDLSVWQAAFWKMGREMNELVLVKFSPWFQVIGKKGRTRITTVRNAQKHQIPKCTAFRELLNFQVGARRTNGHVLSPAFFLEVRPKTSKNVSRTEDAEHFSRSPQLGCCETQLWWCQHRCGMFFFYDLSCFFSCVRCECNWICW